MIVLWFVTRHVWFFFILYSVYARAPELVNCEYSIADGCFNAPKAMHAIFLTILFALQCLQLFWFQYIHLDVLGFFLVELFAN